MNKESKYVIVLHNRFGVIEVDTLANGTEVRKALKQKTSQGTFPYVFVKGQFIGGFSELSSLNVHGHLDEMIRHQEPQR